MMYRIIKTDGTEVGVTDSVTYIKLNPNGAYMLSSKEDAVGVVFDGITYNLFNHNEIPTAETVIVSAYDSGKYFGDQKKLVNSLLLTILEG